jgi:hypothetical protein
MHSKIVPNEHPMEIGAGDIVLLNIHTNVVTKVAEILFLVPTARKHLIQCRGCLTLPRTCAGRAGSPGLMAKMTVILMPWW